MTNPAKSRKSGASSKAASASYAAEVTRLLWPQPWSEPHHVRGARGRSTSATRDSYVFPRRSNPRLLVPADVPASFTMLKRLGNDRSRLARPMRAAAQWSGRSGLFKLTRWPVLRVSSPAPGADSIETYLSDHLGQEVRAGVVLGPRRVNQKPVLQLFASDGTVLGFAKVGHNQLTAELVRREAGSLADVNARQPQHFRAPRLLHAGQWSGLDVLVMSPLVSDPRLGIPANTRVAAMRELSIATATDPVALSTTDYWARISQDGDRLSSSAQGPRLTRAIETLEDQHGSVELRLGGWHGDWGTWNMGMGGTSGTVLQLWDWERYDPQVPIGFDALHLAAQRVRAGHDEQPRQQEHFLREVPLVLDQLDADPENHDLTLHLYLLEMGLRYADALQHGATPALRKRLDWVLDLAENLLAQPRPTSSKGRS